MMQIKFNLGLAILFCTLNVAAQTAKLNENITIKFQSDRVFEIDTDEDLTLEYEFYNDSVRVGIYTLTNSEYLAEFKIDPSKPFTRFNEMLDIKAKSKVKAFKDIKNAYYQIGEAYLETANERHPYILLLIYDTELNALINFEIDCYETSVDEGLSILNSIEIIKTTSQ